VNALYSNTTGNYNVALGPNALFSNTTGGYNVALGEML
jgi:trimeric autotransporter adhesin